jgi:hypothetical protein
MIRLGRPFPSYMVWPWPMPVMTSRFFLLGEATYLMRKATASAIVPVGWPPLAETLEKIVAKHIPIFA